MGIKYCIHCGRELLDRKHGYRSNRCRPCALKRRVYSEEHRRKIGEANKRRIFTEEMRKNYSEAQKRKIRIISEETRKKLRLIWKGRKHTEETKKKMSLAKKGHKISEEHKRKVGLAHKGIWDKEKNPNWHGGISSRGYLSEFNKKLKEQIRKRDNFRCQQCFRHQGELFKKCKDGKMRLYKLNIHHIDFNKKNNNPNNLISLCDTCHGQTGFDREKWIEYYQNKIGLN